MDWYTWLEQGRPISVSTQVLESLVQTLHLNANEREHLFFLAHQQPPPARATEQETVSPTLQHFLDHQGLADDGILEAPALVKSGPTYFLFFSSGCFTTSNYGRQGSVLWFEISR